MEVEIPEKLGFLFEPARTKVAWGGRGSAKSWSFARALLVLGAAKPLRILCAREVQRSLRESVHQLLKDQIRDLGLGDHYRILDTEIRGTKKDTLFMYAGLQAHTAMSIKSYEGVDIVWVEEAQTVPKRSWDILVPTIRKPGSEIWLSMNPELKSDYAYSQFVASPPPGAIVQQVNYNNNPWFSRELEDERLHAKATMDEEDYQNIWEGKPRGSVQGSIFGRQMAIMRKLGRIGKVAPRKHLALNAFMDLGSSVGNATAVWLHQQYGAAHLFPKYIAEEGQGLRHFWTEMESYRLKHDLRWGSIYMPHDGAANLQGAELVNRVQIMEAMALEAKVEVQVVAVPRTSDLGAAIDITRQKMVDAYIDEEECSDGIFALDHYKYKWNEESQTFSRQPQHTSASNGCFTGDTKVITRSGAVSMRDLPESGEVLTMCGWKSYMNARITRRNSPVVTVHFEGGTSVRCTGDHLFLTESGWRSAGSLLSGTPIRLLSTPESSTGTVGCGSAGPATHTLREAGSCCTGACGRQCLERRRRDATSITATETDTTIGSTTLSAWARRSISRFLGFITGQSGRSISPRQREPAQPNGTHPQRGVTGIGDTPRGLSLGLSGIEKTAHACTVGPSSASSSEPGAKPRSTAATPARFVRIARVSKQRKREDVWCMTVPEAGHFALFNGAVVHNCDAFRQWAQGYEPEQAPRPPSSHLGVDDRYINGSY